MSAPVATPQLRVAGGDVLEDGRLRRADLLVENGRITGIVGTGVGTTPDAEVVDARGRIVAPGFVDTQVNGGWGIDLAAEPGRLWELAARLPSTGVTSFLPTLISSPAVGYRLALEAVAARPPDFVGATPVGWHFEGPMLSHERAGAHPREHLVAPSMRLVEGWTRGHGVAMVTLAPELDGADQVIRRLADDDVVVALGHTDADTERVRGSLDAGVSHVTHLFNAMRGFHHRDPGPIGVALADDRLTVGLIADGVHVSPEALVTAWRTIGSSRLCLVTDATAVMGTDRADGLDAVRRDDGTLAGTVLTMDAAVRRLRDVTGASLEQLLPAASTTPARVIGSAASAGIRLGAPADVVVLDRTMSVETTICGGRVVHRREPDA